MVGVMAVGPKLGRSGGTMGEGQSCDTDQDLDLGAWTGPQGRTYKYIYLVNKQKQNTRNTGSVRP